MLARHPIHRGTAARRQTEAGRSWQGTSPRAAPGGKLPSPSWQAAPGRGTGQAALPAYTWQAIKQPRKLNQEFYNFTKHHN